MKITVLSEDYLNKNGCISEHGLCLYIETENHTVLADTGASGTTVKNAEKLGIDLKKVDTVVLSHGHYDHTGGALPFSKINQQAKIYIHKDAVNDFYNNRTGEYKYIGIDKDILRLPGLIYTGDFTEIDGEISLFSGITGKKLFPGGNKTLLKYENGEYRNDDFSHEQCLVIKENGNYTLVSGCAHNGIINIINRFTEIYGCEPSAVISGFHFTDFCFEEDKGVISETANILKKMNTVFYTGHCTCPQAYDLMKNILGEKLCKIC